MSITLDSFRLRLCRVLAFSLALCAAAAHAEHDFAASSSVSATGRDLLVDFGSPNGLWGYAGAAGAWTPIHDKPLRHAIRADIDHDGIADSVLDFGGGAGIWALLGNGSWQPLTGGAAQWIVAADIDGSGRDDLIVDFGSPHGIWVLRDASAWLPLTGSGATSAITLDLDHNGRTDVLIDFGPQQGLWAWMNNAAWQPIHGAGARWMRKADLDRNGQDDLVVDFGSAYGIWIRYNNASWRALHGASARSAVAADLGGSGFADTLVIDFGDPYGIWRYSGAAGWRALHGASAKGLLAVDSDASGRDDVVIDFGSPSGIWRWRNDAVWERLHAGSADSIAAIRLPGAAGGPALGNCPLFPGSAMFNLRIDDRARFPVHGRSAAWIGSIGATRRFHADWGTNADPQRFADYYGIPYNVIDGTPASTAWPAAGFPNGYPDESDCAAAQGAGYAIHRGCDSLAAAQRRFPFPLDGRITYEGGACNDPAACGDRHVLVLEQGRCRPWESWLSYQVGGAWTAGSTAAWDLASYALRPDTWTSADAAGLPILPLLARADEASAGEVRHALRVTFADSVLARSYVWPARHAAGGETAGGIPFGALLRLRADFVIPASWTTQARALARAMQRYGLYVADIGSNLFVQGEPSAQWDPATIDQLQTLEMSRFEFVDLSAVTGDARFDPASLQGAW